MAMPRKDPVERACLVCGGTFLVGPWGYGYRSWDAVYCSVECRNLGRTRKSATCNELTPTQAAYLAGMVDGEGSFMLKPHNGRNGVLILRVTIVNTHLGVLEWCKQVTGIGSVIPRTYTGNTNQKTNYSWVVSSGSAASFVIQIQPYLIIKAAHAALALDACERLRIPALKADRTWQAEWRLKMQALNKRGPRADPAE